MEDASRIPRKRRTLAASASALLALLTLVGGAALAAALEDVARILVGLATFGAYILLSGRALKHLPVDWDAWRAPDLVLPPRSGKGRLSGQGGADSPPRAE
jgi:hypothetical protein